ncbi:MAG: hypothetical protein EBU08_16175 [Micrococcales bacterium]|nr:hypothetical protein [Micrococcales bacterium]
MGLAEERASALESDLRAQREAEGNRAKESETSAKKLRSELAALKLEFEKMAADKEALAKSASQELAQSKERLDELGWEPFQSKILRNDLEIYMDSDKQLSDLQSKIEYQQEKVDYLEGILKGIAQRHWVIRNALEWKKMMMGMG